MDRKQQRQPTTNEIAVHAGRAIEEAKRTREEAPRIQDFWEPASS